MDFPFLFSIQVEPGQILTVTVENDEQYAAAIKADKSEEIFLGPQKGGPGSGGARPGAGRKPHPHPIGGSSEPTTEDRSLVKQEWKDSGHAAYDPHDPQGIGTEESMALYMYGSTRYNTLNSRLRTASTGRDDVAMQRLMDSGISKMQVEKGLVFRGMQVPGSVPREGTAMEDWVGNMFVEGKSFSDSGYMSSTSFQSIARDFAGSANDSGSIMLEIESHSGVSIRGYTSRPYENEVLFKRNTEFHVESVSKYGSGGYLIRMTEKKSKMLADNVTFMKMLTASEKRFHELMDEHGQTGI